MNGGFLRGKELVSMLSEDVNDRSVNLAVRVGNISGRGLRKALVKTLAMMKKKNNIPETEKMKHGRTTLKQLQKQNEGLSTIELKHPDLRMLNKIMKKHGVDFAVTKDGKDRHTLFFKGKDVDSVTHAFEQYAKKILKRGKENQPIKRTLTEAKKISQTLSNNRNKEKNRNRGGIER
jgi:hypothetical protein